MLAAKNNSGHLDITPCVPVFAVLPMLSDTNPRCSGRCKGDRRERRVLAGKRNQTVKALGARGLALRVAPDFIMAGWAGISNTKSYADEEA
jgi:hypothetical protein